METMEKTQSATGTKGAVECFDFLAKMCNPLEQSTQDEPICIPTGGEYIVKSGYVSLQYQQGQHE